jgi:hypothetical protein
MLVVYIGFGLTFAALIFLVYKLFALQKRLDQATAGKDGASIETALHAYQSDVTDVLAQLGELRAIYDKLLVMTELAAQKISIVRFNPFGDTGGDQSFSLAVLDAHESGYILSSIHGREGTRVYVKPIDFGESKYPLSVEEQKALKQASKRTLTKR